MLSLPMELVNFLWSFISHWQSYATGGVVTGLIQVYERLTANVLTKRTYFRIFVVTFSMAGFFMAWREQYERANTLQAELNGKPQQPIFQVNPPSQAPPQVTVVLPSNPSHTRLAFISPQMSEHPPFKQGQQFSVNLGYYNTGDYAARDTTDGAVIAIVGIFT